MHTFEGVFFDLDGTLIDTAQDMGLALNLVLEKHQKPILSINQLRAYVSKGSAGLIKFGFNVSEPDNLFYELRRDFLELYEQNIATKSRLFAGMDQVISHLEESGVPWGIVTNKPGYLTDTLLSHLKLDKRTAAVISGDSLNLRKPHPEPLLAACEQTHCDPKKCLYVGDADTDIKAAQAAGMKSCAALYGYFTESEDPYLWGADYYIKTASELLNYINT